MNMLSCKEIAELWGVTERYVTKVCSAGRVKGAVKEKGSWKIPSNAEKPNRNHKNMKEQVSYSKLPLPIGISDYIKAQRDYYYVDKTLLIKDFLDKKTFVTLFTRPRRFGKTLNMDMLRVFFEKSEEDTSIYFQDKNIWLCGEKYREYQGKYPVIFLTFKDVKYGSWEDTRDKISALLQAEYDRHSSINNSKRVSDYEKVFYHKILEGSATELELSMGLENLTKMLHKHYGIAPVIIIDEYDTPIEQGYSKGYYEQVIDFMRIFFSGAFKDNSHLSFGFLTGILKIAQESIFSGLNNLKVNSILEEEYCDYFGFTKEDIAEMISYYGIEDKYQELMEWYDGYRFGKKDIFNPWSVINYIDRGCVAGAYWVSTGNSEILDEILKNTTTEILEKMNRLMQGERVVVSVSTNVIYPFLGNEPSYVYSFLLVAGYLKAYSKGISSTGNYMCELSIPNKEIGTVYRIEVFSHLKEVGMIAQSTASAIEEALFLQNKVMLENAFSSYLNKTISYYDTGTEGFYHGLLAGILAIMDKDYRITSNRESGDGRYDLSLLPLDIKLPGIIIELKYKKNLSEGQLEDLAKEALEQIDSKRYVIELQNSGVSAVIKYGIAFSSKKVRVCKSISG